MKIYKGSVYFCWLNLSKLSREDCVASLVGIFESGSKGRAGHDIIDLVRQSALGEDRFECLHRFNSNVVTIGNHSCLVSGNTIHFTVDETSSSNTSGWRHEMSRSSDGICEPFCILCRHKRSLMRLNWQLPVRNTAKLLLIRVLSLVEILEDDDLLDWLQLTKELSRDLINCNSW